MTRDWDAGPCSRPSVDLQMSPRSALGYVSASHYTVALAADDLDGYTTEPTVGLFRAGSVRPETDDPLLPEGSERG